MSKDEKSCAETLRDRIEEVVGGLLPDKDWVWPTTTYIQDPIWGEIKLEGHEAALLNTPLMQRLRRIKQLGTVHLVFPGATHTRFEHSLGVLEQASRMCDGLNEGNEEELVSKSQKINLRFAALCHDLGHGPFSHCSELFYPYLETYCECGGPTSAEKLSALIVKSKSFRDFCDKICENYRKELEPDLDLDFVANAITGDLSDDEKYLGEIIHGPFDADKIDYLMRDGQYCGMPIKVDAQHIHRSMTRHRDPEGKQRLVGKPRAAPALIQLVHQRQHMFAVAYWHRTARVSKGMLLNALRWLQKRSDDSVNLGDVFDLFSLDDEQLLSLGSAIDDEDNLFQRLHDRRLFQIAMRVSADASETELFQLIEKSDGKNKDEDKRLAQEAQQLAEEIAKKAGVDPHFIVLDPAWPIGSKEAIEMLIMQSGKPKRLGKIMKVEKEGLELQKFLNHHLLCCPTEHVDKVKEAARSLDLKEADC